MPDQFSLNSPLLPEVQRHYTQYDEAGRLFRRDGHIERVRTQELIARYLPSAPATIYDIGGGPGVYALWLAQQGYRVHLLDAMPRHIEQARVASVEQTAPITEFIVGDARHLPLADESADMVLLLGPLYHLIEREDRLAALREARRVLRPQGVLCAAVISRFASLLDGFKQHAPALLDPTKSAMITSDLLSGQHRNHTDNINYFTTTYFHHPNELRAEIEDAGLEYSATLAIEGPLWLLPDVQAHWSEPEYQQVFLSFLRQIEQEPALIGASSHILGVAHK